MARKPREYLTRNCSWLRISSLFWHIDPALVLCSGYRSRVDSTGPVPLPLEEG